MKEMRNTQIPKAQMCGVLMNRENKENREMLGNRKARELKRKVETKIQERKKAERK